MPSRPWIGALWGLAVLVGGALPAAANPFARCQTTFLAAPERWDSARCFYEVAMSEKLWEEAGRLLDELAGRHPDRPWLLLARAYVEEEREPGGAAARYRAAIDLFVARGEAEGEVRTRCVFAGWLARLGEKREAGAQLAAALRRAQASGASELIGEALIFQARHLRNLESDFESSYRLARRAEGHLFPRGPAVQQLLCLDLLANLARDLGRRDEAEHHFRRLEILARESGRRTSEARAQLGLGLLLFDDLDRAPRDSGRARVVTQLNRALSTAVEVGDPVLQARTHSILGYLLDPPEAQGHLTRCLALAPGREDTVTTSCLLSLVRVQAETDPVAAERSLKEAHAAARRAGDLDSLARFWYGQMNFSWRFRPREQAIADAMEAIRAVEALRDRQLEQLGRAGLFSRWLAPYYAAAGHLLDAFQESGDPADLERAFAITESMRARVLRELLATPRSPDPPVTLRVLEESLAPEEALLSFQVAPRQDLFGFAGGSWLLVSTRGGTRVHGLQGTVDRAHLETAVSALLGLIERRDGGEAELAASLFDRLLAGALADLPPEVDRLVIVPDGVLHLLPFAVLRPRSQEAPLADRYRISLASSGTLWARWRRQERRDARAALVLADPALPIETEETPRLPGARREGRHVRRRVGPGSILQAGAGAGEAFLKRQDLSRFGVLHLAAHAVAEEASPEASAVLLAADGPREDGRLQVDEITRLDLRGSLVALSSCRSASGALLGGEGIMSLTRAFFAAGSAVVIGSLWPVRDDDAEAFFTVFYDHLAAGETAAAAFSAAQRERIRDGAPAQSWAGFVLSGDGGWRLPGEPRREAYGGLVWIAKGILLLVAGYALARRRRRAPELPDLR